MYKGMYIFKSHF